ncbi:uncharacterized protein LOC129236776 isoform X1 [Anastrepha obliqua]|uniref:uncharacterized protein LOC129236776 isoform X1 n=1 Tax=Anastrepha obliqua TaxID=95512 RepID=UPI00240A16BE|nr:uncharacterized protein LOC129236776 isoform X1 [Anastrepha obliqua]XP_054726962.1 uncharacterized protein LOC129236776 isoform X1 [Anastrepha obliqua]XP_054726963.1 uncharacterized protein LOC129236776 isoform X1 [Anastrepha obliqua]XP_054726964.1 uncharacterized protein LOC129236776 isoform X1 [Anastrepha obliqua]
MTTNKDTASFFENGTTHQFEYCYKLYPQVLKLKAEKRNKKPQELIRLDEWYQNELPKLIKARGKDAHMVYDELVQTMKWKQSRGKFYPQLSYLVKVNTPRAVMQETKKAFRKLPNLEQAITALSNLKGVGTTMASALLAAAAPDSAPFMADECLMAIPEIEGIDYTTKEYLNFVQHIYTTVERLNVEAGGETPFWSPHRVELALWAHYVANDLSPELLDEMPGPGAGGGANINGSTVKVAAHTAEVLSGEAEDTNDGDEESLGAAENNHNNAAPGITTATTSLQDGDSNFVSNDSTSQEPNIDENTTQTTATTSTDDGEVGTPLASDSESNLEAPEKAKLKHNSSISNNPNTNSNSEIVGIGHSDIRQKDVVAAVVGNGNRNGNGNGTLVSLGAPGSDGENSSCLRSTGIEDASEEDDVDAEDDSSNSNSRHIGQSHKSITPLFGGNLNDGTNYTTTNASDSNNDSTLSSAAGGVVAQKRTLQCNEGGSEVDGIAEEAHSQPELKKIRSE